ncbi:MAG: glycosyltransferase family 4 protein, partial [Proteobacteria bacterium]|nr:glycosyltransferase family 4 protein [Pseudomonadota bacterium]
MSVAVVLKGYPRLSETFIAQEIQSLQKAGLDLELISLRHPTDTAVHPVHREINKTVLYLPEYLWQESTRVIRAWWRIRKSPHYSRARRVWLNDLKRDLTPNRIRRFGQSLVLANELSDGVTLIYAHFLHTPSSVARYAALLRNLPWSFSAHAKDIWTTPEWEKREKITDCAWGVTCTETGSVHLKSLTDSPDKITLLYHGLDIRRFSEPSSCDQKSNDGTSRNKTLRLFSVGRAVPKKGFFILLDALAALPQDFYWHWQHVGGGSDLRKLQAHAADLGLNEKINWLGPRPQEEILSLYRQNDLFLLPSRITEDGDRDGLPNVLMEAASQKLAIVSTALSGICEFIETDTHGLLVPPDDSSLLLAAIRKAAKPDLRSAWA